MSFIKYQRVEKVETVARQSAEAIRGVVKKAGKQSAADLTDEQRKNLPR